MPVEDDHDVAERRDGDDAAAAREAAREAREDSARTRPRREKPVRKPAAQEARAPREPRKQSSPQRQQQQQQQQQQPPRKRPRAEASGENSARAKDRVVRAADDARPRGPLVPRGPRVPEPAPVPEDGDLQTLPISTEVKADAVTRVEPKTVAPGQERHVPTDRARLENALARVTAFAENAYANDATVRQSIARFCEALSEADRCCRVDLESLPLAASIQGAERPRRVRFATTSLLPLTTPNIGIEGSERAVFDTMESLSRARVAAEALRESFRAAPEAAKALRAHLGGPMPVAAAEEGAPAASTIAARGDAGPEEASYVAVPPPEAARGPSTYVSPSMSSLSSSSTAPPLTCAIRAGSPGRYRTMPQDVVHSALLEIMRDEPCTTVEEPLRELVDSAVRFILRKLFNVPPTCEVTDAVPLEAAEAALAQGSAAPHEAEATNPPAVAPALAMAGDDVATEPVVPANGGEVDPGAEAEGELEALAASMSQGLPRPRETQLIFGEDCGSYQFNSDDAAAVLRDAMGVLKFCRAAVDAWRAWHTESDRAPEEAAPGVQLSHLQLYVGAHVFVDRTFVKDQDMRGALAKETELLGQLASCCTRAQELGLDEELAFAPLARPAQFAEEIESQRDLVGSLKEWLAAHDSALHPRSGRNRPRRCRVIIQPGHVEGGEFRFPVLFRRLAASVCPLCETTVEDSNRGGEICCERCGRWHHLRCLQLPQRYPQTVDTWTCPTCLPSNMI